MQLGRDYDPRELKLDPLELELRRKMEIRLELEQRLKREYGPKRELKRSTAMDLDLKLERERGEIEEISLSDMFDLNNRSLSKNRIAYGKEPIKTNSERNSRGVFGVTKFTLHSNLATPKDLPPAPEGRRIKKEKFKGKGQLVKFRCTAYEKKLLIAKAKRCGISLSEMVRRSALEQTISERFSEEEIEHYKMLVKYHNNFKSIGNMFKGKNEGLTKLVYSVAKEIKEHLKKFNQ
jgi:hypothetical protein